MPPSALGQVLASFSNHRSHPGGGKGRGRGWRDAFPVPMPKPDSCGVCLHCCHFSQPPASQLGHRCSFQQVRSCARAAELASTLLLLYAIAGRQGGEMGREKEQQCGPDAASSCSALARSPQAGSCNCAPTGGWDGERALGETTVAWEQLSAVWPQCPHCSHGELRGRREEAAAVRVKMSCLVPAQLFAA